MDSRLAVATLFGLLCGCSVNYGGDDSDIEYFPDGPEFRQAEEPASPEWEGDEQ